MSNPLLTPVGLRCVGLRCAHQADPLGVAPDRVRLSWRLEGAGGGGRAQCAYQILVTDDTGVAAWDSGRVESAATMDVAYRGSPLTAGGRYRWKVRVWDETGLASDWSVPARFEVELDRTGGWYASWIAPSRSRAGVTPPSGAGPVDPVARGLTPAPYLRREFRVDRPVASARLYVTALGLYEARLNGQRVGDAVLAPGWTDYTRRIAYQAYDVTSLLAAGENVLGAIVADGWYAGFFGFDPKRAGAHYGTEPELLAQLVLRLADGSEQRIVTDGQWESSAGAIRHADLLMGERHDLTRELRGWDAPGFDAGGWRPVRVRYRLLGQDTMPSWRYMIDAGATTIWERWDGWTAERGFASPEMNSFNHYALGSVGEWLYRFLLGIDQEPGTAGFGRLLLRPHPGGSLDWARGTYQSVRGRIRAGWRRERGRFTYWAELPPNVTATVRIASDQPAEVRDAAGNPPAAIASFPGADGAQEAVFGVGSGTHEFSGPALTRAEED